MIVTDSHKKEEKKTRQNDSSQTAATKLGLFSISKQWRFNNCCQNSWTKMSQLSNFCGSNLHVRCNYRYETYLFDVAHWLMTFCYQNCSDLLWEEIVIVIEKNFWNSRLKAENLQIFEINWKIHSNSERSEQFLGTECFFNLFLEVSQI